MMNEDDMSNLDGTGSSSVDDSSIIEEKHSDYEKSLLTLMKWMQKLNEYCGIMNCCYSS